MTLSDLAANALAVLAAVGGGGAVVWALSSQLGKVWAQRLMQNERAEHERALAEARASLEGAQSRRLEELKASLTFQLAKQVGAHQDKIQLYRSAADLVVEMVVMLGAATQGATIPPAAATELVLTFERKRLQAYAFLGMFAPQAVMDSYDAVIDYLLDVLGGDATYDFKRVRTLGISMLNEIRVDLGIDRAPIAYRGSR